MLPVDWKERAAADQLVEEYARRGLTRRELLVRGVALGLSASAIGAVLDACGGGGATTGVKTVDLVTTWGATELDSLRPSSRPSRKARASPSTSSPRRTSTPPSRADPRQQPAGRRRPAQPRQDAGARRPESLIALD